MNPAATILSSWTSAASAEASHTIGGPMISGSSRFGTAAAIASPRPLVPPVTSAVRQLAVGGDAEVSVTR
jgi:hypothetical protein